METSNLPVIQFKKKMVMWMLKVLSENFDKEIASIKKEQRNHKEPVRI